MPVRSWLPAGEVGVGTTCRRPVGWPRTGM